MRASTLVLIFVLPISVLLNILFVHHTSLGFLGSPVAISITYWLAFALLCLLTYLSPTHRRNGTWDGLQFKTVSDFRSCMSFLGLAVPGILMVGTEWYVPLPSPFTLEVTCAVQGCLRNRGSCSGKTWGSSARCSVYHHDGRSKCVKVRR